MTEDVVRLHVEGPPESTADFRRRLGRRAGMRVRRGEGQLTIEAAAARIEALGPAIEAAALASGTTLRLADLDAIVRSRGLNARPSGVWAAIGDAADRRAIDREVARAPSVDLLHFVQVEERGGRRVAVDRRPPRVDHPASVPPDLLPTKFDDASWHADGAAIAGQPATHAWTHIALFLTWLIRRDLVDRRRLARGAEFVRNGGIVDQRLMDRIDGKLVSDLMTDEGADFSKASYDTFLEAYERVFAGTGDYAVAADLAAYARIEPELDALWAAWKVQPPDRD